MKTYEEILKEVTADADVWNMDLETYNHYKKIAREIFKSQNNEEEQ